MAEELVNAIAEARINDRIWTSEGTGIVCARSGRRRCSRSAAAVCSALSCGTAFCTLSYDRPQRQSTQPELEYPQFQPLTQMMEKRRQALHQALIEVCLVSLGLRCHPESQSDAELSLRYWASMADVLLYISNLAKSVRRLMEAQPRILRMIRAALMFANGLWFLRAVSSIRSVRVFVYWGYAGWSASAKPCSTKQSFAYRLSCATLVEEPMSADGRNCARWCCSIAAVDMPSMLCWQAAGDCARLTPRMWSPKALTRLLWACSVISSCLEPLKLSGLARGLSSIGFCSQK